VEPLKKAILIVSQIDMGPARTLAIFAVTLAAWGQTRQGDIEFFGHEGLDEPKLRAALSAVSWTPKTIRAVLAATDVAIVCCDEQRRQVLFVGIAGPSYSPFPYNPEPTGTLRLGRDAHRLADAADKALEKAVRRGDGSASEDDSAGYAMFKDPDTQRALLKIRQYALAREPELRDVLAHSAHVRSRQIASEFLGYATASPTQIAALVAAVRDPDGTVRNNATRALGVLLRSNSRWAAEIPVAPFVAMARSGIWTDRNKAVAVLDQLTATRDPTTLKAVREGAESALLEIANWKNIGWSYNARMVIGRLRSIPEAELERLASLGPLPLVNPKH
jgi:hypothetical protein